MDLHVSYYNLLNNEINLKDFLLNGLLILANMAMMGNPQQMTMANDAQKSLGVPPDMMMSFPFGMNLPSQGKKLSHQLS